MPFDSEQIIIAPRLVGMLSARVVPESSLMVRWSQAKLDQVAQRSIDRNTHPVEAKLALAGLLAAEGQIEPAEALVLEQFEKFEDTDGVPEDLVTRLLEALIIVNRLDLAARLLERRHTPGCRVELEFHESGSGEARILVHFALPERLKLIIDRSILTNDKTDVEVLWLDWIFPVLAFYAQHWPGDCGTVMFSNWDDAVGAGLAMCSNRPDCFLIPDNVFVPTKGYAHAKLETKQLDIPWDERKPIAFWRGSTTGQPADRQVGWRSLPRLKLSEIARENPQLLDAGISKVIQIDDAKAEAAIRADGLMRLYVPARDFNGYKYQIDIDGNTSAWPGLFLKLLSGNPVLKIASSKGYRQWYYDRLKPWINFVPVAADMSDLVEKITWLQTHDDAARAIGEQGQSLAYSMDFASELERSTKTISAGLRYFSHRPEVLAAFEVGSLAGQYLRDGWDNFGDGGGAVMLGHESALELPRPIANDDFVLSLDISLSRRSPNPPGQRIVVIANGEILHQGAVSERTTLTLCLPHRTIIFSDRLHIRILHPDAKCAASQESPLDNRYLSMVLHHLTLTAVSADLKWSGYSSYIRRARQTNLVPIDGPIPPRSSLCWIVSHHGTLLYMDPQLEEVRHGARATSPQNLFAAIIGDTAILHYAKADGSWHFIRINPTQSATMELATSTVTPMHRQGLALVRQADKETVGLAAGGLLLCAEGNGRVTLSARQLSLWEMFRIQQIESDLVA